MLQSLVWEPTKILTSLAMRLPYIGTGKSIPGERRLEACAPSRINLDSRLLTLNENLPGWSSSLAAMVCRLILGPENSIAGIAQSGTMSQIHW